MSQESTKRGRELIVRKVLSKVTCQCQKNDCFSCIPFFLWNDKPFPPNVIGIGCLSDLTQGSISTVEGLVMINLVMTFHDTWTHCIADAGDLNVKNPMRVCLRGFSLVTTTRHDTSYLGLLFTYLGIELCDLFTIIIFTDYNFSPTFENPLESRDSRHESQLSVIMNVSFFLFHSTFSIEVNC